MLLTAHAVLLLALIVGSVLAAWVCSFALPRMLRDQGVLDTPNARSSHAAPVPRGGGVGFAVIGSLAVAIADLAGLLTLVCPRAFLVGGALLACVGFVDDVRGLSKRVRLVTQLLVSCWLLLCHREHLVDVVGGSLAGTFLWPAAALLGILLVTWIINSVNFIDGLDGYAATIVASVLASLSLLAYVTHGHLFFFPLLIAAPILGFLAVNLPPARIFMGDSGALWLGFALVAACISAVLQADLSVVTCLVLLALVLGDTSWTLFWRLFTGQAWHEAHRSHAYQKLSRLLRSHGRVDLVAFCFQVLWLLPLAWLSILRSELAVLWLALAYLPVLFACLLLGAGREEIARAGGLRIER